MSSGGKGGGLALTTGTKLKVSNLDGNVSSEDIEELFGELGPLKSAVVGTSNGVSKGFAIVVYKRKADAEKALEQYNGVPLDGKPLKIVLLGGAGASVQVQSGGKGGRVVTLDGARGGRSAGLADMGKGRGKGAGRGGRGGKGEGKGGGKGDRKGGKGGKGSEPAKSMDDLDAELDAWRSKAPTE